MTVVSSTHPRQRSILRLPKSSTSSILLILLTTDIPQPNISDIHGEYPEIFTTFFEKVLASWPSEDGSIKGTDDTQEYSEEFDLIIESYDVVSGHYPPIDHIKNAQGLLITGSEANAYDKTPWILKLIDYISKLSTLSPKTKQIGICFGHQIMSIANGGKCEKNLVGGWEVGTRDIHLSKIGQKVFGQSKIAMQQVHQDFVPLPPIGEGWHSIGGTSICEIHGLVKFNSFNPAQLDCLTFQGHPEFNSDIMNGIVDNLQASYDKCQPEGGHGFNVDEESKLCVERPHDGIMLGRVMLNMFGLQ